MAYKSGFGTHKQRHEGGLDPNAAAAREEGRKVRGGEGEGQAGETTTDENGVARELGRQGGEARKDEAGKDKA